MEPTTIRQRLLSALIVGATGANVLRVVTAFEQRRIVTLRANTIAQACDRIAVDMPHVVLSFVLPENEIERDALADRALAVGAMVVNVDPELDNTAFQDLLDRTIILALERQILREEAEHRLRSDSSESEDDDEVDDGWGE